MEITSCFRRSCSTSISVGWGKASEEIRNFFEEYCSEDGIMTIDDLLRFITDYQKDSNVNKEDAQRIINGLKHRNTFQRRYINYDGFLQYLLGDLNTPLHSEVHHDMDAPLSHYFLYASQNSDSTGNQLSRASTVDTIVKALKKGVRVIDLDLWPNSNESSVDVCHGGTLTSPVDLKKCLLAIKDNAFVASEYPLLINFEDLQSLNPDLQNQVSKVLKKTFGKMLYYVNYSDDFPSPNNLKRKVLILTELPTKYLESQDTKNKFHSENLPDNDKQDQPDKIEHIDEEEDVEKAAPEFRELIAINTIKMKGRPELWPTATQSRVNRLSISEQQLQDAIETHTNDIISFTQWNILTVHPNDQCFGSPNYNPCIGWLHGAQMVKLNMQGYGRSLWLMHGMFRANGGCGYVKKPDFLMNVGPDGQVFNPKEELPVKKALKVKVYMGYGWHLDFKQTHFDIYSPPDFYCRVGIAGVRADQIMRKTKTEEDNWTPVWEEEFEFPLTVPELALLRVEVHEYEMSGKDDFAGQTCLPVSELRPGLRAVSLCDRKGEKLPSVRLLMRFEFV